LLIERAVWPMRVVVGEVLAQHLLELPARHDQDPVETFATDAADPALGMRFRPWRRDRRPDRPDPFRTEDLAQARASRCGLDAVTLKYVPDATRREPDPEPNEFAVDALGSPTRLLRRQTQDQLSHLRGKRRPARPSTRIRPAARTRSRCQRKSVAGRTTNEHGRGKSRPSAANRTRSADRRRQPADVDYSSADATHSNDPG
jgi:hypothetical protein